MSVSKKMLFGGVLLGLAMSMSGTLFAESFKPVDEAAKKADFLKFRTQLKTIIAKKDAKALLAIVDKNIHMSYGDNNGLAEFKKEWQLEKANSPFWSEMSTVLSLGGQFDQEGEFTAPYVFSAWPESKDGFENIAVIGQDVRVRSAPNLSSKVLTTASYEILPLDSANNTLSKWVAVKTQSGKTGYIAEQYARSPVDYRAFFKKDKGSWKLITFIAGD
jgi:hypothetical protein